MLINYILKRVIIRVVLMTAKSLQSYPTLCDPIDSSPPGSPSLGFSRQEHWSGVPSPSLLLKHSPALFTNCVALGKSLNYVLISSPIN